MLIAFVDTKNLVQEKESKLKESFKLMGMKLSAYWLSWFITNFIFILPTLVVFSVILGVDFGVTGDKGSGPILADTAPSMIFCGFLCYRLVPTFSVVSSVNYTFCCLRVP